MPKTYEAEFGTIPCDWWYTLLPELGNECFQLLCFLWSNKDKKPEGIYSMPVSYMAGVLDVDRTTIKRRLQVLIDTDHILYDFTHGIVLLRGYMQYQGVFRRKIPEANISAIKARFQLIENKINPQWRKVWTADLATVPFLQSALIEAKM